MKQVDILSFENLVRNIQQLEYYLVPLTTCIWKHNTRQAKFCRCVGDLGVEYFDKYDAKHLHNLLQETYKYTIDYTGHNFCCLMIN